MNKALCSLVAMPLMSTTRPSFSNFVVVSAVLRAIMGYTMYKDLQCTAVGSQASMIH